MECQESSWFSFFPSLSTPDDRRQLASAVSFGSSPATASHESMGIGALMQYNLTAPVLSGLLNVRLKQLKTAFWPTANPDFGEPVFSFCTEPEKIGVRRSGIDLYNHRCKKPTSGRLPIYWRRTK